MHLSVIIEAVASIISDLVPAGIVGGIGFALFKLLAGRKEESRSAELKRIKEEQPEFFKKVRNQSIELLERY